MGYEGVAIEIAKFFKVAHAGRAAETLEIFGVLAVSGKEPRSAGATIRVADMLK